LPAVGVGGDLEPSPAKAGDPDDVLDLDDGARQSRVPSEASYGWSSTAATTGVVQSRETIPSRAIIIGRAHGLANVIVNKPGPMSRAGQD
jgi:hypothetical protein